MNQPINKSGHFTVRVSAITIYQSGHLPGKYLQSINQIINQSINQSGHLNGRILSTNKSINQLIDQSINQTMKQ